MKGIVLVGGAGARLWLLSRKKYSKQFLKLFDGTPLLESTYERLLKFFSLHDIITIKPTSPETGYRCIKAGDKIGDFNLQGKRNLHFTNLKDICEGVERK